MDREISGVNCECGGLVRFGELEGFYSNENIFNKKFINIRINLR